MAEENSSIVAIFAIIVIILIGVFVVYYFSDGFKFSKTQTTIVQPTTPSGTSKATTNETTTIKKQ